MKKIENIQEVYDSEIDLITKQSSLLLLGRSNSFTGELKTSGLIVENYIKGIISKHIPRGYRVCSGYIATSESILDTDNLSQHDLIIVDERTPSLYKFGVSDIEIVPAESVCGIIEIKRTLTTKSITNAIEHIDKTKELLKAYNDGIKSKNAKDNIAGPTMGVATHSPLYAIIGLGIKDDEVTKDFIQDNLVGSMHEFIDLIWSLSDGMLLRYCVKNDTNVYMPRTVTRNLSEGYAHSHSLDINEENNSKGKVFRIAISMLRTWINNTSGARLGAELNQTYFGI